MRLLTCCLLCVSAGAVAVPTAGAQAGADDPAAWLFDPGAVVGIDLDLPQASIDALNSQPDEYVDGTFTLTTPSKKYGPYNVGVRLKGRTSFRPLSGKAAFKLKLPRPPAETFLGLRTLTLNNMVQDRSMIHEALAYEAFRSADVAAPRTGYAYVRVNDQDYGVYLNVETPDRVMLPRWFESTKHLYEGESDPLGGVDVSPGSASRFGVDEGPETDLSDLEALIAAANGEDGDWSDRMAAVADLQQMTKMWAVEKYIGHWDAYAGERGFNQPNNYFLHSDSAGKFRMLPWGTDQTWARRLAFDGQASLMFDKCLGDASCFDMYRAAVREVRARVDQLNLDARASKTAELLAPWQEKDPRREYSVASIQSAVSATRQFVAARPGDAAAWLDPPAAAPMAQTGLASSIQSSSATVHGTVSPNQRPTSYRFEYGTTTDYGESTPERDLDAADGANHQVSADLAALTAGQTYHYRLVAKNDAGETRGADRTFTAGSAAPSAYRSAVLATPGLRTYWRLGEPSGTAAGDERNAFAGNYTGRFRLGELGALTGDRDTSSNFDGLTGEMTAGGPTLSTAGSIEGWFLWRAGVGVVRDDTFKNGWILAYDSGGALFYRVGGTSFNTGRPASSIRGGWHHIVATKDGGNSALYVDGQLVHNGSGAGSTASAEPWHIMRNGKFNQFAEGLADEVAIYDAALPATVVRDHFELGTSDRNAPGTWIHGGPSGLTGDSSPRFDLASDEFGATYECRLDGPGAATGTAVPCSSPKAFTSLADGDYRLRVTARDPAGNADASAAERAFTVDTTLPTATGPVQTLVTDATLGASSVDASLAWSGSDNLSSASQLKYDLQQRVNSTGTWGTWASALSATPLTAATRSLNPAWTYQFQVRTRDLAGNVGSFSAGPAFRAYRYEESTASPTLAYSGSWSTLKQSPASGGKVRTSSVTGAKATLSFTGRNVAVVMPKQTVLGTATICLDPGTSAQSCSTVDLSPSSGFGDRKLVFTRNGLSTSAPHKVQVTVAAGRVDLDAFVALR